MAARVYLQAPALSLIPGTTIPKPPAELLLLRTLI
jgi:hypothetical protein